MKSKTLIEKQTKKKKNSDLVETILLAKKNSKWIEIASILSRPRRKQKNLNLDLIEKNMKSGKIIVVPGKVLSLGKITKKIKIAAVGFSEKAKEKLLKNGCEIILLKEEIKKNKEAKNIQIIKWK